MIQLRHNGAASELDPGCCPSLGQAIELCTGGVAATDALVRVSVDGREIPEKEWDAARALPTQSLREIEVESRSFLDVAWSALGHAQDYATQLVESVDRTAALLRTGRLDEGNTLFAVFIDALSLWLFSVTSAVAQLGPSATDLEGLDAELAPWLVELEEAQVQGDALRVADLVEFEVARIIREWQSKITVLIREQGGETNR